MIETKYLFNPLSPHIKRGKQQPLKIKNPSPHSNHLPHPPPLSPPPSIPARATMGRKKRKLDAPTAQPAHCPLPGLGGLIPPPPPPPPTGGEKTSFEVKVRSAINPQTNPRPVYFSSQKRSGEKFYKRSKMTVPAASYEHEPRNLSRPTYHVACVSNIIALATSTSRTPPPYYDV